jgi:hypothetical protein
MTQRRNGASVFIDLGLLGSGDDSNQEVFAHGTQS